MKYGRFHRRRELPHLLEKCWKVAAERRESKRRIPSISPNDVAVALWIKVADVVVLLGSDLEKRGWVEVLQSKTRPEEKASAFKIPHHGSENAHEPDVWKRMLEPDAHAVLTPWSKGGRTLPSKRDAQRILSSRRMPMQPLSSRHLQQLP